MDDHEDDFGIVRYAEAASNELAGQFADDPEGELFARLRVAQRREAMVSEAYGQDRIEVHLKKISTILTLDDNVTKTLRVSLGSVWAQETAHERHLKNIIDVIDPPATFLAFVSDRLNALLGRVEGLTIAGLTTPDAFRRSAARLAVAIGSLIQAVPAFVNAVDALEFSRFCLLNAALEQTAVDGYRRIKVLIDKVAADRFEVAVSTVAADNGRSLSDERYHYGLFKLLADWAAGPPSGPPGRGAAVAARQSLAALSHQQIATEIVTLQARIYGSKNARDVMAPPHEFNGDAEVLRRDPVVEYLRRRVGHHETLSFDAPSVAEPNEEASVEERLAKLEKRLPKKEQEGAA